MRQLFDKTISGDVGKWCGEPVKQNVEMQFQFYVQ